MKYASMILFLPFLQAEQSLITQRHVLEQAELPISSAPEPITAPFAPTLSPTRRVTKAPKATETFVNRTQNTTQFRTTWPLQHFRMIFIEHPDDELVLADKLSDYLTQQLQLIYSETVLINVFITMTATQINWQTPYFVYEFVGEALMALPPTSEDITELQRLQLTSLANTVALHAFWQDKPLLWYLPPPPAQTNDTSPSIWIWIVIAVVMLGGILCSVFFVWRIRNQRKPKTQNQPPPNPLKAPTQDDAASIAWSTPMGKVVPASFYVVTTRTPSEDEESLTHHSMSASPIRAPVHQFDTDSILMDGYSDPENDHDPASPPRPRKSTTKAQFMEPAVVRSEPQPTNVHSNRPINTAKTNFAATESVQDTNIIDHPSRRAQMVMETKKALFVEDAKDNHSLPSDEGHEENASVSPENDVLGYYLRRKRSA
jgi:hypothetical protein